MRELAEFGWSGIWKKRKKEEVWGAVVIVWNFEEERFRRILKGCLAVSCAV